MPYRDKEQAKLHYNLPEIKEQRKQYLKKWEHENREYRKQYNKEYGKKYREKNKEKAKEYAKQYYMDNREKFHEHYKNHYQQNKAGYIARSRARDSTIKIATPPWVDMKEIEKVYKLSAQLTEQTGILHHVDHIEPLQGKDRNGLHVPWNLRAIPASENLAKGNRTNDNV